MIYQFPDTTRVHDSRQPGFLLTWFAVRGVAGRLAESEGSREWSYLVRWPGVVIPPGGT